MKVLAVILSAFTLAFVSATSNEATTQAKNGSMFEEIVGGTTVDIIHFPTQVAILEITTLICSGNIIKDNVILSVAHCLAGRIPLHLTVRSGSSFYNLWGHIAPVATVEIHPQYIHCQQCHRYDIAIATLYTPAVIPGIHAHAIRLWGGNTAFGPGTVGAVAGWGATEPEGQPSAALVIIFVPILSHDVCTSFFGLETARNTICTGSIVNLMALCPEDSGAGLIINGRLAGLAAFGRHCGALNTPAGYTSIAAHREWIHQETGV